VTARVVTVLVALAALAVIVYGIAWLALYTARTATP
jgi:hypothetical protein